MTDTLSPRDRSALMASIHGRDTTPEMIVRRLLHQHGLRYRLHAKDLPGRPDVVFRSRFKAIFVHGCFWHQHKHCRKATVPKTRSSFWDKKLKANVERDSKVLKQLKSLGWRVLVVWECELRNPQLEARLISFVAKES